MSTFEEVKAKVEGLWLADLADLRREREEVERATAEAWKEAEQHQLRAGVLAQRLDEARSELASLPGKLGEALLADDQGEVLSLQGSYAALKAATAEIDLQLQQTHEQIGAASVALQDAEESEHDLRVRENEARQRLWDEFDALEQTLFLTFARSIGADRLPTQTAAERETYLHTLRREAQRFGAGRPPGIVVKSRGPNDPPETITVRPGQLAASGL